MLVDSGMHLYIYLEGSNSTGDTLGRLRQWTIRSSRYLRNRDPTRRGEGAERSSIMAHFYTASTGGCTKFADLVTITINVGGVAIFYTGNPQSLDEVFCIVATLALAAGDNHTLTSMSQDVVRVDGEVSWLSMPSYRIQIKLPKFSVGGLKYIQELKPQHIKLDLLFFEVALDLPTPEEMQWTYQFFPDTPIRSRVPGYKKVPEVMRRVTLTDETLDKIRRLFFLNACKNGLPYICRLWETLKREIVEKQFDQSPTEPFTADESYRPAAIKLLERASPPIVSNLDFQNVLVHLSSFIVDPRAVRVLSQFTARIRCNGDESAAIVTKPIVRGTHGTFERLRLAIPRDLLHAPWHLRRLWLLEPYDRQGDDGQKNPAGLCESLDGRWRIVGKMICLGNPCIPPSTITNDKDRSVTLRTEQIVFG
jgi:hypothetical protein